MASAARVLFAFEGTTYETDLNDKHRRDLERTLTLYIAASLRVTARLSAVSRLDPARLIPRRSAPG
ncbi:Lsr2 dimerization domain-containing protein [Streptomyces sp. NBC_01361]|uniref:Lsr2 dimerization domain-containing protein n=1 Tax=Streptomyces sp. NBC_01361 TaxID=2903838 RepID=UPI003FCC52E3